MSWTTPLLNDHDVVASDVSRKNIIDNSAGAVPYGLHTPPRSDHEDYGSMTPYSHSSSRPCQALPSIRTSPQSVTPLLVPSRDGCGFSHAWSGQMSQQLSNNIDQMSELLPHPSLGHGSSCMPFDNHGFPNDTNSMSREDNNGFGMDVRSDLISRPLWHTSQQLSYGFLTGEGGMEPTLFAMPHNMAPEPNASPDMYSQSFAPNVGLNIDMSADMSHFNGYDIYGQGICQPPSVVMPSQLSSDEEYPLQQYSDYDSTDYGSDGFPVRFDPSTAVLGVPGATQHPSPADAYFTSMEEVDRVVGRPGSPNYVDHDVASHSRNSSSVTDVAVQPARKRTTRRSRKSHAAGKGTCWSQHTSWNGIDVQCEGKEFRVHGDPLRQDRWNLVYEQSGPGKAHRCTFVINKDGDECGRSFDRSEHLKRHMGMHSNERPYPCPLPDCRKRIQRPDNAGDHFKTHLRQPSKGKRNTHYDWETVRRAILANYEDKKKAKKLLENLGRWIEAGMPDNTCHRRF